MSDPGTSLLDAIEITLPCQENWADMRGDEFVRRCAKCKLSVHNVSEMPRERAEALLAAHAAKPGEELCVRLYRRPDGTVVTGNCLTVAKRIKRRTRLLVAALAAVIGLGGTTAAIAASASGDLSDAETWEHQPLRTLRKFLPASWLPAPPVVMVMGRIAMPVVPLPAPETEPTETEVEVEPVVPADADCEVDDSPLDEAEDG